MDLALDLRNSLQNAVLPTVPTTVPGQPGQLVLQLADPVKLAEVEFATTVSPVSIA